MPRGLICNWKFRFYRKAALLIFRCRKRMKKLFSIFLFAISVSFVISVAETSAQTRKKRRPPRKKPVAVGNSQTTQPIVPCSAQTAGIQEKTYTLGASPLSEQEKNRIEDKYGTLIIP